MKPLSLPATCHGEPFPLCHSERSEESHTAQDRLREESLRPFPFTLFRVRVTKVIFVVAGFIPALSGYSLMLRE